MNGWKYAHIGVEGDNVRIADLEAWKEKWRDTKQSVKLPHPQYPGQVHSYQVYEMGSPPVRFAAVELSAGVWGFYVPVEHQ